VQAGRVCLLAAAATLAAIPAGAHAEWVTARGDFQRTGSPDGRPGPAVPRVLWAYKAKENYVASPTPGDGLVFVSGLGAYNTGLFRCLSLRAGLRERVLWSKSAPFIKRPTVCSPALTGGLVIFGDGMHQTDDAWLYGLRADTGRLVWQLPVPGKLVHLEAAPTVDRGSLYVCGGAAGVLCLALDRVMLGNEEMDLAQAQERMDKAWQELKTRYEAELARHPDFAVPPDEDALPKPAPKIRWQKGRDSWHVDAPTAVSGSKLLVTSCFLDEEKVGNRALICLRAESGESVWETPLNINPWAGPTVAGGIILAGCSSIASDPSLVKQAAGEVVAADRGTGQVKWRQSVPGGVLSPVAVSNEIAFFTATDGKLRAVDVTTGAEKWTYDVGAPCFAGPAVAGVTVYAVDLKGVLHAVNARDGKRRWMMDVPGAAEVFAPGMVYGSPVVADGRIYLGTCNVHGGGAGADGALVCIADESVKAREAAAIRVEVDPKRRSVTVPCRIAPRKLPFLAEIYPLEVVASLPAPAGQKAHETVVTFEASLSEVRQALLNLGLREGKPIKGDTAQSPSGDALDLLIEWPLSSDTWQTVPVEALIVEERTGRALPDLKWHFTGSAMRQPDPEKDAKILGAEASGTLATLFPVTDETLIQSSLEMADRRLLRLDTDKMAIPPEGTEARLVIVAAPTGADGRGPAAGRRQPPLSWRPPPVEVSAPYDSGRSLLVPFSNGVSALPPAETAVLPSPLLTPARPIWRPGPAGDAPYFTDTVPITRMPAPPLPAGHGVPVRRREVATPVSIPPPSPPQKLEAAASGSGAVERDAPEALRVEPALRQTPAPRIPFSLPDPFETERALRALAPTPDADGPFPLPPPPAVTNLPTRSPAAGAKP
jgi:outer membrane protein assembly factor BamB